MRINYSDDEDFDGQFALWQGNCERSIRGKQGQAVLREMETALVALPTKRLIRNAVACDGEVCALGAYLLMRRAKDLGSIEAAQRALEAEMGDEEDQQDIEADELGVEAGMPRLVAWKLVALNDIELDEKYVTCEGPTQERYQYFNLGYRVRVQVTPEERYERVLAWVRSKIKPEQSVKTGTLRRRR